MSVHCKGATSEIVDRSSKTPAQAAALKKQRTEIVDQSGGKFAPTSVLKKPKVAENNYEQLEPTPPKKRDVTAGYEMPNTPVGKPSTGYDFVAGSPAGQMGAFSKFDRSMLNKAAEEEMKEEQKRNRFYLIVGIVLLSIATITIIVFVGLAVTAHQSKDEAGKALTDFCQATNKKMPGIDSRCVYHRNKYPDSCKETKCNTVEREQVTDKFTLVHESAIAPLTTIPDYTPCKEGNLLGWCKDKICVESDDKQLAEYHANSPIDGRFEYRCDEESKCLTSLYFENPVTTFRCHDTCQSSDEVPGTVDITLGYRICTKFPQFGGKLCEDMEESPFFVKEVCPSCSDVSVQTVEGQNCAKNGQKCEMKTEAEGYCLGNRCIPKYSTSICSN